MLRMLSVLGLLLSIYSTLPAQSGCPGCETMLPDNLATDTIFLSAAPDGQVGIPYDEDLSFRLPMTTNPVNAVDPDTPAGLTIDELRILGVAGLPAGLQWEASETVFAVMEQTDGCVKFCGTPFLAGLYEVEVILEAQIFVFTQQTSFSFFLLITPAETVTEGFSIENNAACGSLTTGFINNIPSNGQDGFTYFWDMGNGNTTGMETPNPQTYNEPGEYEINYQAIIDTAGFFLTEVVIEQTPCTDIFNAPDLKIDLFDPNGDHVHTTQVIGNVNLPVTYDLLIPIGEGDYELHVIDDDGGLDGADDLCGIIIFNRELSGALTAGGLSVNVQLIHPVDTVQSSEFVYVYPIPAAPQLTILEEMPFCEGETLHLISTNYTDNLNWFVDSLIIPAVQTDTLEITEDGIYTVFYTSENGCISDTVGQSIMFSPLPSPLVLQQDGNLIRVDNENQLPEFFTFNWFFEGNLIPSAGLLLCAEAAGVYTLEITDTSTGCSRQADIDAAYNPEINCSTNINDIKNRGFWLIYPNPFSTYLQIENPVGGNAILNVFDVLGRQIYRTPIGHSNNLIRMGELTSGIYFYQIQTPDGHILQKGSLVRE